MLKKKKNITDKKFEESHKLLFAMNVQKTQNQTEVGVKNQYKNRIKNMLLKKKMNYYFDFVARGNNNSSIPG